ncbi:MAG: hypothetical protein V4736_11510 [Bdellovibrionota bacterium]
MKIFKLILIIVIATLTANAQMTIPKFNVECDYEIWERCNGECADTLIFKTTKKAIDFSPELYYCYSTSIWLGSDLDPLEFPNSNYGVLINLYGKDFSQASINCESLNEKSPLRLMARMMGTHTAKVLADLPYSPTVDTTFKMTSERMEINHKNRVFEGYLDIQCKRQNN